jgi:Domain of unknown function (DUF4835)
MKNIFFLAFFFCLGILPIFGQELNIKVSIVTQGSINSLTNDASLFKDLEKNITEFINTTKWTDDEFEIHEKIRGSLQLTITEEVQPNVFRAELVVQTERPVYNSTYSSPLINLIDKNVSFTFNGLQPLLKTTNTFYDNLSSILSFYVYYIMGMDYDSFSLNGGEQHFQKAQEIITSLPSNYVRDDGWKNDGGGRRNRYWLIENILNPRMRQFRQAFYEYHRLSLDKMYDESDKSRAVMLSALTSIGQANLEYPNTYLIQMFGDAKKDEVVEIFKLGDKGQKVKVKGIMVGMDASKTEKYSVLN